jgi:hypothetical protein
MNTQDRRLKGLEAKCGTGVEKIAPIIRVLYEPSPNEGAALVGFYGVPVGGDGVGIHSQPSENIESFERRLYEKELNK